uniref:Cyclin-dependent kinase inhibitor 2C (p18, inhibits CDK4) n=1 Tax=Gasterosteus aculeatus aculeatus TaxID=481459 RepID=G3PAT9_GASAC
VATEDNDAVKQNLTHSLECILGTGEVGREVGRAFYRCILERRWDPWNNRCASPQYIADISPSSPLRVRIVPISSTSNPIAILLSFFLNRWVIQNVALVAISDVVPPAAGCALQAGIVVTVHGGAWHEVVQLGSTAVIEALLRAGADPNLRDPVLGLTVMHDAAREGFADSVRVLLAYGADPNLVDDTGNLPLHLAATEGHLEATRQLIAATADPRAPNGLGHSAGQEARIHKRVETAQYIEDYLGTEPLFAVRHALDLYNQFQRTSPNDLMQNCKD